MPRTQHRMLTLRALRKLPVCLLCPLPGLGLGLGSHDSSTPVDPGSIIEVGLGTFYKLGQLPVVLALHCCQGQGCRILLVYNCSQPGFALQMQSTVQSVS